MKRPGVRIPLPPVPKAFGTVAPSRLVVALAKTEASCRAVAQRRRMAKADVHERDNGLAASYDSARQARGIPFARLRDCRAVVPRLRDEGGPIRPCERERSELRLGVPISERRASVRPTFFLKRSHTSTCVV